MKDKTLIFSENHEKTCNSIPPYSSPEDDKTCMGIFECYGNMSIIILSYRTQIRRICIFSTLNKGYFCDVRDKIVAKGTLGSLRTRSSIIKFTFFFLVSRREHLMNFLFVFLFLLYVRLFGLVGRSVFGFLV